MKPRRAGGFRRVGVVAVAAAHVLACGERPSGETAPVYGAETLAGDSVRLGDLRGSVVMLNVWATWCAPCRAEIPILQRIHETRRGEGLQVVGVSVDDPSARDAVARYVEELGMTYAIWLDPSERVSSTFLLHGIPSTLVIGPDGRERWRKVGPIEHDDPDLARAIDAALAARPAR